MNRLSVGALTSALFCLLNASVGLAAPRPDLYPNSKLNSTSAVQVDQDIRDCMTRAEDYTSEDSTLGSRTGRTARGAVGGAAKGALAGAIMGNTGRGAGAGAALGAANSAVSNRRNMRDGSPEFRKYTEACLDSRGYKVVGWR